MPPAGILSLKVCNVSLINSYVAISVENWLLNPNYSLENTSFLLICSYNLTLIIFSKTFKKDGNKDTGL
jgi:hypothetical protein